MQARPHLEHGYVMIDTEFPDRAVRPQQDVDAALAPSCPRNLDDFDRHQAQGRRPPAQAALAAIETSLKKLGPLDARSTSG